MEEAEAPPQTSGGETNNATQESKQSEIEPLEDALSKVVSEYLANSDSQDSMDVEVEDTKTQTNAASGVSQTNAATKDTDDDEMKTHDAEGQVCEPELIPFVNKDKQEENTSAGQAHPSCSLDLGGVKHTVPSHAEANPPEQQVPVPDRRSNIMVSSLKDGLKFQEDCLAFLEEDLDNSNEFGGENVLENLHAALSEDSLSTAYSGIEAVSTATNLVARALSLRTGQPMIKVPLLHMVEWDPESQQECLLLSKEYGVEKSPCVFGNIASFYRPEMQELVKSLQESLSIFSEFRSVYQCIRYQSQSVITVYNLQTTES